MNDAPIYFRSIDRYRAVIFYCRKTETPAKYTAGGLLMNSERLHDFLYDARQWLYECEPMGQA